MEYDLWGEIRQKIRELEVCIKELRKTGTAYAEAERDYKIKLREECLRMRADGMAVGMVQMTAYGIPEVAELRFRRDVAETVWKANQEAVNSVKLQLRILESQLQREWGSNG